MVRLRGLAQVYSANPLRSGREDCIAHCWNEWRDARLSDAGRLSIALYEVHETALHESLRRTRCAQNDKRTNVGPNDKGTNDDS